MRRTSPRLVVALLLLVAGLVAPGCAGPEPAPAEAPDDSQFAKRPFTAEQIRDNMPVGSWTLYSIVQAGQPAVQRLTTVSSADADSVVMTVELKDPAGQLLGAPQEDAARWDELMRHASFPVTDTTIRDVDLETPAGRFACWRYEVIGEEEGVPVRSLFYFAKELPGAPVRYEMFRGEQSVYSMTLVDRHGG